jgi:outer membrane protein OmpA-like peptidoglycan-associated protein
MTLKLAAVRTQPVVERRMAFSGMRLSLFAGTMFTAAAAATSAEATCADLVPAFDQAVAARSVVAAIRGLGEISDDPICGGRVDEFRARLIDFLVAYASSAGVGPADRGKAIAAADRTLTSGGGNWRGAEKLADYFMGRGDKLNAYLWYQRSTSILNTPGIQASPDERRALLTRMAAAQSLANDDQEGRRAIAFNGAMREVDGSLGGIYSPALLRGPRGVAVVIVPIPVNFYTNETRFTPTGEKAMQELAEAAKTVRSMKLLGHADPRGSTEYNMDLSRRRVEAVRAELLRRGVNADIRIEWKGANQPFNVSALPNASSLSQEEIWQLDRRVEWVRDALPE